MRVDDEREDDVADVTQTGASSDLRMQPDIAAGMPKWLAPIKRTDRESE